MLVVEVPGLLLGAALAREGSGSVFVCVGGESLESVSEGPEPRSLGHCIGGHMTTSNTHR